MNLSFLSLPTLRNAGLALVVGGTGALVFLLARAPASPRPGLGARGLKRRRALAELPSFALVEPFLRYVAGWMSRLPLGDARARLDRTLLHAGTPLGLTPDELIGGTVCSAVGMLLLGALLHALTNVGAVTVVFLGGLGVLLPYAVLTERVSRRAREVNRSLPIAIDLMSMCMGAGLDFPGAVRQVLDKGRARDALNEELARLLQELGLGHTRRQALEHMAERVPTEAVRDLVGAVVQAEEKGTPLAEVLGIQAGMQRMRRSIRAEEEAAKAGIKMMIPLTLIFASIITLLLGPFIVNAMQSGW